MRDDPGGPGGMIVNCAAYCGGRRVADLDQALAHAVK